MNTDPTIPVAYCDPNTGQIYLNGRRFSDLEYLTDDNAEAVPLYFTRDVPLNEGGMSALRKERELRKDAELKVRKLKALLYPDELLMKELVVQFKHGWHAADQGGWEGRRTWEGLRAALRLLQKGEIDGK